MMKKLHQPNKMKESLEFAAPFADWLNSDPFALAFAVEGEIYRHEKNRKTVRFLRQNQAYYIKMHHGVGWGEICKNLFQGRIPVLSAKQEWQALKRLKELNIPTMEIIGFGQRGLNPARLESFLITKELAPTISLEDLAKIAGDKPLPFALKHGLIKEIARMARLLHRNGINHRDFYICHFLLAIPEGVAALSATNLTLYVIDLHRAQIRGAVPQRWLIKDLAALYFSCMDLKLTRRDVLRFIKYYNDLSLTEILKTQTHFWQRVSERAADVYLKVHGSKPNSN